MKVSFEVMTVVKVRAPLSLKKNIHYLKKVTNMRSYLHGMVLLTL